MRRKKKTPPRGTRAKPKAKTPKAKAPKARAKRPEKKLVKLARRTVRKAGRRAAPKRATSLATKKHKKPRLKLVRRPLDSGRLWFARSVGHCGNSARCGIVHVRNG